MKILIQGGGIAGLTLAAALNKHGIFPTIIEQAPAFGDIGFWVYVYDNGRKILRNLGVEDKLDKAGYIVPGYRILNEHDEPIHAMDFSSLAPEYIAATSIERPDLHQILVDLLDKKEHVHFNTKIETIVNGDSGVQVTLNDGTSEEYDLVVAADGMHSYLRSQVFPTSPEKSYGMHAWLFSVSDPTFIPDEIIHRLSSGAYAVQYPHGKKFCGVYLAARAEEGTYTKEHDGREDLARLFKHFGAPISELIAGIHKDTPMFHDDIHKVENSESYKQRVVLIGDAQHAMSPLLGQGSSLAMEDAFVLALELVVAQDNIDEALQSYHDRRDKRVHEVQKFSNLLMGLMAINNPLQEEMAQQLIKHFAPRNLLLDELMKRIEKPI